ncbi:PmoA family protein [Allorhodopirellula heiligendammensis]|uniref:Methane oxygenase PmoA n=1 Tax=Allorhodopirellula heiligendammensis TaxID=2714739 RepID=A0A5C6BTR8_9BACT|nr:PmoA family protein [Allorhodopirellula heiligendammensis]TWU15613.1 hypothetical protein Poly21_28100 [Allorhodopirellula heiligendammensis]
MKTVLYCTLRKVTFFGLTAGLCAVAGPARLNAQQNAAIEIRSEATASSSTSSSHGTTGTTGTAAGFRIESSADGETGAVWRFSQGDRVLATYHADLDGTPGFYPLLSPAGLPLTRNFPMQPYGAAEQNASVASRFEKHDHPHHRSMWFDHGDVNGVDFWATPTDGEFGQIVQRTASSNASQSSVVIDGVAKNSGHCDLSTSNDWIAPDGKRLLSDERQFRFHEHLGDTIMDVTIKLIASDGDVTFGDTKEGSLGVRMAGTVKVDAKLGGEIHNAEGLKDNDTWGKISNWVDYSGPIAPPELPEGDAKVTAKDASTWARAGITMMYHPGNKLPDCYWHVRSYGLFAANPFGRHHFGAPAYDGVKIEEGQTLTLHFRLVLHNGMFDAEKTRQHYDAYAAENVE